MASKSSINHYNKVIHYSRFPVAADAGIGVSTSHTYGMNLL